MKINLESLKSSGVYTFEYDASQTLSETTEYGRLIIGSSKSGPFNTIVQLQNDTQKKAIYGSNDRALEKKGSYFHKSLEVALREGPVYAMNVLPVDTATTSEENQDCGYVTTFNTDSASTVSGEEIKTPLLYLFDRQKFWKASNVALNRAKDSDYGYSLLKPYKNKVLTFSNASQRTVTVFVQKSSITGYDITVSEWYKSQGDDVYVPEYLADDDLISDYMVNVFVVEGDWTNYRKLNADPVYTRYFDQTGLVKDKVNEFLMLKGVNVIVNVSGCLIPDFKDNNGSVIAIDRLFNNYYASSQMICAIDQDNLDQMTLEGEQFVEDDITTQRVDIVGNGVNENASKMLNVLSYKAPIQEKNSYNVSNFNKDKELDVDCIFDYSDETPVVVNHIVAFETSDLYKMYSAGYLNTGDKVECETLFEGVKYAKVEKATFSYIYTEEDDKGEEVDITVEVPCINIFLYEDSSIATLYDIPKTAEDSVAMNFDFCKIGLGDLTKSFDLDSINIGYAYDDATPNMITFDFSSYINADKTYVNNADVAKNAIYDEFMSFLKVNSYIYAKVDGIRPRMLKIMTVANKEKGDNRVVVVKTLSPIMDSVSGIGCEDGIITFCKGIQNFTTAICGSKLSPFKVREQLLPNGTAERQDEILEFLFEGSNLATAIAESEEIDIRYIIDSYEGQITSNSKYYLSKLAATHAKCAVFTNAPSMKQFENCDEPKFIDTSTGLLNTKYIADGGNLDLNPSVTYGFASDTVNGVPIESFTFPCIPNLTISENGVRRSMVPAPYVCNAYMRKFEANSPYVIVAGQTGKLTENEIVGVEYEFTKSDRDNLEPAGYNLIIQRRREGIMLFSNNTAYQSVKSALNNAHVRDTLITIEKRIERILFNFLFRYNTAIVRSRVKTLVDNYLSEVQLNGGIASFTTQIDENNNDTYVLENNSAVIDIQVNFNRGIHKFVNKITITRANGELSIVQSGFSDL